MFIEPIVFKPSLKEKENYLEVDKKDDLDKDNDCFVKIIDA